MAFDKMTELRLDGLPPNGFKVVFRRRSSLARKDIEMAQRSRSRPSSLRRGGGGGGGDDGCPPMMMRAVPEEKSVIAEHSPYSHTQYFRRGSGHSNRRNRQNKKKKRRKRKTKKRKVLMTEFNKDKFSPKRTTGPPSRGPSPAPSPKRNRIIFERKAGPYTNQIGPTLSLHRERATKWADTSITTEDEEENSLSALNQLDMIDLHVPEWDEAPSPVPNASPQPSPKIPQNFHQFGGPMSLQRPTLDVIASAGATPNEREKNRMDPLTRCGLTPIPNEQTTGVSPHDHIYPPVTISSPIEVDDQSIKSSILSDLTGTLVDVNPQTSDEEESLLERHDRKEGKWMTHDHSDELSSCPGVLRQIGDNSGSFLSTSRIATMDQDSIGFIAPHLNFQSSEYTLTPTHKSRNLSDTPTALRRAAEAMNDGDEKVREDTPTETNWTIVRKPTVSPGGASVMRSRTSTTRVITPQTGRSQKRFRFWDKRTRSDHRLGAPGGPPPKLKDFEGGLHGSTLITSLSLGIGDISAGTEVTVVSATTSLSFGGGTATGTGGGPNSTTHGGTHSGGFDGPSGGSFTIDIRPRNAGHKQLRTFMSIENPELISTDGEEENTEGYDHFDEADLDLNDTDVDDDGGPSSKNRTDIRGHHIRLPEGSLLAPSPREDSPSLCTESSTELDEDALVERRKDRDAWKDAEYGLTFIH